MAKQLSLSDGKWKRMNPVSPMAAQNALRRDDIGELYEIPRNAEQEAAP